MAAAWIFCVRTYMLTILHFKGGQSRAIRSSWVQFHLQVSVHVLLVFVWFSPGTPASCQSPSQYVSPAIDCWPVQGLPWLSPWDSWNSWDSRDSPPTPTTLKSVREWMDGWDVLCNSLCWCVYLFEQWSFEKLMVGLGGLLKFIMFLQIQSFVI